MKKVTLVVANWCPICPSAKAFWRQLKEENQFPYEEIDIESDEGQKLLQAHSIRSVPTTLIDGEIALTASVPSRDEALKLLAL